jgi:Domain of unknown function (DUF4166)
VIRVMSSQMRSTAPPLFRRVLGRDFERLPPVVQLLHDLTVATTWTGHVDVYRGGALLARLAGRLMGLPPAGFGMPLYVTFTPDGRGGETWLRMFGAAPFRSRMLQAGIHVAERMWPVTLHYRAAATAAALEQEVFKVTLLGMPLPAFVRPHVTSREYERDGAYHFEVTVVMPGVGALVRYEGRLRRSTARSGADPWV